MNRLELFLFAFMMYLSLIAFGIVIGQHFGEAGHLVYVLLVGLVISHMISRGDKRSGV